MSNYRTQHRTQAFDSYAEVPADAWEQLWAESPDPTPFVRLDFLRAMESSASASADTGWHSRPVVVWGDDGQPRAALPLYLKDHSYGEYVFDWSWARALQSLGEDYYPKGLLAPPFSPVPGSRILARDAEGLAAGAAALTELAESSQLSSFHVLFSTEAEAAALEQQGWMIRHGLQFHWHNRGYRDFEDFLSTLSQPRRKKIRAERRKVAEAGVTTRIVLGEDATEADWAHFYDCYCNTYWAHGNPPYLQKSFFDTFARDRPEHCLLAMAEHTGTPIAAALLMRQATPQGLVLYGRYWGAIAHVPCLHFELSYYTPLEWAIASGVVRFEGGAQGEHKIWRGFDPEPMRSAHWIRNPRLAQAVAHFLAREGQGMDHAMSELNERRPYNATRRR